MTGKSKKSAKPEVRQMTGAERLGLRISAMINSPRAQERCSALVHRLDTDTDEAWHEVMEALGETDGVCLTFQDDGDVLIEWEKPTDEDLVLEEAEVDLVEEEAPF
ncbi:DUF1654 domain-containing protein [Pseudomonas asiatica]|uniref:DUF1654 domain-containing protein n=1 Tax=Pseudomonas TaxID=286 RepID=UPI000778C8B1|nr:DUF1654 domain-containing protein [Pseudomonas sp. ABFPK]KYC26137.1 hypothetical protein WM94_04715 [Pseudomonas sp. ABFPK]